jgi:hypothetical protein
VEDENMREIYKLTISHLNQFRYIHNDSGKPKSQTFIAKRKAAPLDYTRPEIANDPRFTTGH